MKVLHVMPSIAEQFGGPPVALVGYVRAAHLAGWKSAIVSVDPGPSGRQWLEQQLAGAPLAVAGTVPALWSMLPTVMRDADLIHVHGTFNPVSSSGMWRAIRADRPVIVRPFGTLSRYTFSRRPALKYVYHSMIDSPALRRAAALHFTTDSERAEAIRLAAVDPARSHVVPLAWVGPPEAPGPRLPRGPRSDPIVLFLSRIHPGKGVGMLIDAWPFVRQRIPGATLVVAGEGEPAFTSSLRARAAAIGVGEAVHFAGFVSGEAKTRWFLTADVFVLPSRHENFGVAVVEALSAGLPVVLSPGVALADFVRQHELGVIAPREPEAIATAVVQALTDDALRARCAERGRRAVDAAFAPTVVSTQLSRMYAAALDGRSPA